MFAVAIETEFELYQTEILLRSLLYITPTRKSGITFTWIII